MGDEDGALPSVARRRAARGVAWRVGLLGGSRARDDAGEAVEFLEERVLRLAGDDILCRRWNEVGEWVWMCGWGRRSQERETKALFAGRADTRSTRKVVSFLGDACLTAAARDAKIPSNIVAVFTQAESSHSRD